MKKAIPSRMLAMLALTFSTYAAAQSQLTVYGIIDTNLEYLNNQAKEGGGKANLLRMGNSGLQGPRVGFRGSEDLGNGLKAIFTLEHGFNSDTGTPADAARFFNRGSFMGLETKEHRVTLGRQYTSIFDALLFIAPLAYSGAYEPFSPLLGNLRNDNSVKYRFNMAGLQAQAHYAFGEQTSSKSANAAYGGFVSYVQNGWNATIVADQQNGADVNGAHSRARKLAVAAAYQLNPALRLSAGYRWGQNKSDTGVTALRDDFWWLGANYQFANPFSLSVAYYQDNVKTRNGAGDQPTTRQLTVQGIYALSKRTDLYAAAAHSRNAGLNFAALSTLAAGSKSQSGISLGVRHRF
ncbi:porin [Diaphorobacter ruginosibacter]|uniref:Porin n=1 Tax=Diaphorobacter ruginosibacter TaxID=1715720 RepID=A0A7G9RU18_9BURK|nr:porin [Diaphorobacter ruginosibacter]QNN59093.1 porin [Diaphorobacter ruginosibacter]